MDATSTASSASPRARLRTNADVIYVDMEDLEFEGLKTATDLNTYVKSRTRTGRKTYVVIDEVQEIAEWQKAGGTIHHAPRTATLARGV